MAVAGGVGQARLRRRAEQGLGLGAPGVGPREPGLQDHARIRRRAEQQRRSRRARAHDEQPLAGAPEQLAERRRGEQLLLRGGHLQQRLVVAGIDGTEPIGPLEGM